MALGFGPGSEMLRTVKKQRSSRKKSSLKESSEATSNGENANVGLKFKEATPEILEEIRKDAIRAKNRDTIVISIMIGLIAMAVLYVLIFVDILQK